jgi:hypothetical protein
MFERSLVAIFHRWWNLTADRIPGWTIEFNYCWWSALFVFFIRKVCANFRMRIPEMMICGIWFESWVRVKLRWRSPTIVRGPCQCWRSRKKFLEIPFIIAIKTKFLDKQSNLICSQSESTTNVQSSSHQSNGRLQRHRFKEPSTCSKALSGPQKSSTWSKSGIRPLQMN